MKQTLFEQLKAEMTRREPDPVRVSVTLTGETADRFRAMHQQLGGTSTLSQPALATKLLALALAEAGPRPSKARSGAGEGPAG